MRETSQLLHPRRNLFEWAILLVSLLAFGVFLGYSKFRDHTATKIDQEARLADRAALIEKILLPQIKAIDTALKTIIQVELPLWRKDKNGDKQAFQHLHAVADMISGVAAVLVIDARGRVVYSSQERLLGINLSHRDYFKTALQQRSQDTLYVTAPFVTAAGNPSVSLVRELPSVNGEFGGLIIAGLNPGFFSSVLETVRYTPDMESYIAHSDGKLFIITPERGGIVGKDLNEPSTLFSSHIQSKRKTSVVSGRSVLGKTERLMALRTVQPPELNMDKGLVIAVSREVSAIFSPLREEMETHVMLFALLSLGSTISLYFHQRRRNISERVADMYQRAIRANEERQRAVFDASPDAMLITDSHGLIVQANHQVEHLLGYTAAELLGQPVETLVPTRFRDAHPKQRENFSADQKARRMGHGLAVKALRKDGSDCDVEVSISRIVTDDGLFFASALRDITNRKRAEEQLRIAATAFNSREATVVTDAHAIVLRINRAFTEITGYGTDDIVGQNPRILQSGRHDAEFYRAMWDTIKQTGGWQGEIWDKRKNGEIYPKWLTISAVKDDSGEVTHYIGTHFDITERKKTEEKIKELAFFDQLTGLPNRTLLLDRMKQAVAASSRSGAHGALLFIDLDRFKTLNDTLGHDMGDALLRQVAQRLSLCVREGDTVARLGGDEFVVVLAGLSTVESEAATGTEAVAEKILAALNQAYPLGDVLHRSTASVGVTLFKGDLATVDDLMKQADLAMYKSKEGGRNAWRFFDPHMESAVKERAALENDLRQAIGHKQFLLHYQAQVTSKGHVTGAEVLVRWQHPERAMVSPADFIPLAEETGLILPLGQWVLETACAQLAAWASQSSLAHLTIAVNVSATQFNQPTFVDQVLTALKEAGANPQRLKLELTESLLVNDVDATIEKMVALKARGIGFSLDDFGTGYSSLSYLKRLPLNQLKIDQSFVRDVLVDPNDATIARAIVTLAQSLGLGVIAEGVETEIQRSFLEASGCHAYQGYLFSRPLALDKFEDFLSTRSR